MECDAGGSGASEGLDGVDRVDVDMGNSFDNPAEAIELEYPLRLLSNRLITDSGGAGAHRGGLGAERVLEVLQGPVTVSLRTERHFTSPWGRAGGHDGTRWEILVERRDGSVDSIPGRGVFTMQTGERLRVVAAGGAGYGHPRDRAPEAVRDDVLDRKVSRQAARDAYGVVLGDDLEVLQADHSHE
jgi:N-methylhydantoinase B